MSLSTQQPTSPVSQAEPTWEIAHLFPMRGQWSEQEYLDLTASASRLVEFTDGHIEILPMPTVAHQRILKFLYHQLLAFIGPQGLGEVFFPILRLRIREDKFREPDLIFLTAEHAQDAGEQYLERADLVMEVVSPDDPQRDRIQKRADYAEAGIPEYWIVDPIERRIIVLKLGAEGYETHQEAASGQRAGSALLQGFEMDVDAALAAGEG